MKKLINVLLITALLLSILGCTKKPEEPDTPTPDDTEESGWVYEGPGYEALWNDLGKADIDLSQADGVLK